MAFQQPKIVFEGGGGAGTSSPVAPAGTVQPFGERENKSELIFGPFKNLSIPANGTFTFEVTIPSHLRNKKISVIIFTFTSSTVRVDVELNRENTYVGLPGSIYGPQVRVITIYMGDLIRLKFVNTSTDAQLISFLEVYAYDETKVKLII